MKHPLTTALLLLSCSFLASCGSNPYDDDPLLKPPQLIEKEQVKKA